MRLRHNDANFGIGTLAKLMIVAWGGYDLTFEVFAFSAGSSASMRDVPTPR